ncbi:hypothetical protein [uncultured Rubinisphaera sp.]|uniref:hypothetical protein n=1 Tax=uncultured Rubinisphaera sp. TaxID=1678686 RepID=UPI0030D8EA16
MSRIYCTSDRNSRQSNPLPGHSANPTGDEGGDAKEKDHKPDGSADAGRTDDD